MTPWLNTDILVDIKGRPDGLHLGNVFTRLVEVLREHVLCENVYVNDLMQLTWRLVGNKKVLFAAHSQVPTLSFIVVNGGHTKGEALSSILGLDPPLELDVEACFISPLSWLEQIRTNFIYCLGGLIFNASQCRDYWNNKIDPKFTRLRGMGYEAEFLHLAMKRSPFQPNDYQQVVMTKYPNGVADIRPLLYDCRPYLDAH